MNILCPVCNGGASGKKSFHLWKDRAGRTMGKCYRATCGYVGPSACDVPQAARRAETVQVPRESLGSTHRQWLVGRVGQSVIRRLGAFSDGLRLGLPVYGPDGCEVGYVSRAIDGSNPKAVSVVPVGYGLGSWYTGAQNSTVVLVEDQLSAASVPVHTQCTGVALLGCSFNVQLIEHLLHRQNVLLALDPDAKHKAVQLFLKYRSTLPNLSLVFPRDDLKNLPPEEIRRALAWRHATEPHPNMTS